MGQTALDVNPQSEGDQLEDEVVALRGTLASIATELDRRRRAAFDWRLQLREHARSVGLAAAGVALLAGMAAGLGVRRRRRARGWARARVWGDVARTFLRHPERLGRSEPEPGLPRRLAAAAAAGAAGAIGKVVAQRLASF